MPGEEFTVIDAELADHFVIGPDVELSFLAFGIGVERSAKRALLCGHFTFEPADCFVNAAAIHILAGAPVSDRQKFEKLRIVVEHLFEVRHEPALIHGISRKPAAEVVVDAALADVVERDFHGFEVARFAGA